MEDNGNFFGFAKSITIAVMAALILFALIIPITAFLLDILMAVNLLFALAILLVALRAQKTADFSSCPTMFLLSTIFGMAVNITAVRLILSQGAAFDGKMIRFVSSLFAGAESYNLISGCVIFIVIWAVQLLIIAKGAARVAEVAALFTLDAMPGKLMAIDAEYNSGEISEDEAAARKFDVQRVADFLGAMDGAGKFISGNEKLKLVIIVVSIVGGIIIGTQLRTETINDALRTYLPLSIANASLFIVHEFLLYLAIGTIITRAAWSKNNECKYF